MVGELCNDCQYHATTNTLKSLIFQRPCLLPTLLVSANKYKKKKTENLLNLNFFQQQKAFTGGAIGVSRSNCNSCSSVPCECSRRCVLVLSTPLRPTRRANDDSLRRSSTSSDTTSSPHATSNAERIDGHKLPNVNAFSTKPVDEVGLSGGRATQQRELLLLF